MDVLLFLKHKLIEVLPSTEATIRETNVPLPCEAYDSSRRQYNSTRLLAKVSSSISRSASECVLGVTEVDPYASGLNFVFGEAQMPGRVAIVSLFRLKPEFYGKSSNSQLFNERALKEAVHEIGHTLGLVHCRRPTCVMYFSNSILDTDRKTAEFCEKCRSPALTALRTRS